MHRIYYLFALAALVVLPALFGFTTVAAQPVDVISPTAAARLISSGPVNLKINSVSPVNDYIFATGTSLSVYAVNLTKFREQGASVPVRSVTLASAAPTAQTAIGTSIYFFSSQSIYRLNASVVLADETASFNVTRDVASISFLRPQGLNPFPTLAFSARVNQSVYGFFVGSEVNQDLNRREIIRLDPQLFDTQPENATKSIFIEVLGSPVGLHQRYTSSQVLITFSNSTLNSTIVASFDPVSEMITSQFSISDFEAESASFVVDETTNCVFIGGSRFSNTVKYPHLIRVNLTRVTNGMSYNLCSDSSCFSNAAVVALVLGTDTADSIRSLEIDPITGSVFIALWNELFGSIARVNPLLMTRVEPTIFFSQGRQNPGFLFINPTLRYLVVFLDIDMVSFVYPTICPRQCEEFSTANGRCIAGKCECKLAYTGVDCATYSCSSDCGAPSNRGFCNQGQCVCSGDWGGDSCNVMKKCTAKDDCQSGICAFSGTCCPTNCSGACQSCLSGSCSATPTTVSCAGQCGTIVDKCSTLVCGGCSGAGLSCLGNRCVPQNTRRPIVPEFNCWEPNLSNGKNTVRFGWRNTNPAFVGNFVAGGTTNAVNGISVQTQPITFPALSYSPASFSFDIEPTALSASWTLDQSTALYGGTNSSRCTSVEIGIPLTISRVPSMSINPSIIVPECGDRLRCLSSDLSVFSNGSSLYFLYVRLFNPINATSTTLRAYDVALSFTSLLVDQLTIRLRVVDASARASGPAFILPSDAALVPSSPTFVALPAGSTPTSDATRTIASSQIIIIFALSMLIIFQVFQG